MNIAKLSGLVATFTSVATAFSPATTGTALTTLRRTPFVSTKTASSSQLNLGPAEAWDAYSAALETDPLLVKSVTAGVILGAADLVGQAVESATKDSDATADSEETGIDWARSARFGFFGLVLQAPWNHFYYMLLDGQIPPTPDPVSPTNLLKIGIDQFVQAPVFTVMIFVFLGLLEGKTTEAIKGQLENDYQDTMIANWKLWLPATAVNIGFVPPLFRVLYLNVVFFAWSIYLSLVLNKSAEEETP